MHTLLMIKSSICDVLQHQGLHLARKVMRLDLEDSGTGRRNSCEAARVPVVVVFRVQLG